MVTTPKLGRKRSNTLKTQKLVVEPFAAPVHLTLGVEGSFK